MARALQRPAQARRVRRARRRSTQCSAACARLKSDSFTGIVPALFVCGKNERALATAFDAGADEVSPTS